MKVLDAIHGNYIHSRRVQVLGALLADMIPRSMSVIDVGCGDGLLASNILEKRPDLAIDGIDVLVRENAAISVTAFDGQHIPFADNSFDAVLLVDVLHHTDDPAILLGEAKRVARKSIFLKDHNRNGLLANATLRFMDYVGNARHNVVLPYNYWTEKHWVKAFDVLGLLVVDSRHDLLLYPPYADWLFGRTLHFIAHLDVGNS